MNAITVNGRRVYVSRFSSERAARSWIRGEKAQCVVMGDIDSASPYWTCTLADAARLARVGYEMV